MDTAPPLVNLAPVVWLMLLGLVLAAGPLAWVFLRHRGAPMAHRLHVLTLVTAFLTFDLILFGVFTRLTDSGLGCPDWPGCFGHFSPIGARDEILAAEAATLDGPVTKAKAWIEMIHRYLATAVGVLIVVLAASAWLEWRRRNPALSSPWWATATLVWVCVQGAFGALTVTLQLYPAIVTLHLLGGVGLLALLLVQAQLFKPRPLALGGRQRAVLWTLAALVVAQIALGGWVSTNNAMLACMGFPRCNGSWWPAMDFANGFAVLREVGRAADGSYLTIEAMVAIHYAHRLFAYLVLPAMAIAAAMLWYSERRGAIALLALAAWQLLTGLTTVVFYWPLTLALAHSAGAALLLALMAVLLTRSVQAQRLQRGAAAARAAPASDARLAA
jgi:cytochrome c oxidase assembly protein subunit 15